MNKITTTIGIALLTMINLSNASLIINNDGNTGHGTDSPLYDGGHGGNCGGSYGAVPEPSTILVAFIILIPLLISVYRIVTKSKQVKE